MQQQSLVLRTCVRWIPFALLAVILTGLVYLAVQQDMRMSANDPQIQMAEDMVRTLNAGAKMADVMPKSAVEVGDSLAPFTLAYDWTGRVEGASGVIDGKPPVPPVGVFAEAKSRGSDRVTWQPALGKRFAAVILPRKDGGFILAARSLREVEKREVQLEIEVGIALAAALVGLFVVMMFLESGKTEYMV